MRICVKDLSGSGRQHDPLSVSYVVTGGWFLTKIFVSIFLCKILTNVSHNHPCLFSVYCFSFLPQEDYYLKLSFSATIPFYFIQTNVMT